MASYGKEHTPLRLGGDQGGCQEIRLEGIHNSARRTGSDVELTLADMQEVVFMLQRNMLYKSMTTYDNHRIWQDVYHINSHGLEIYIKVSYHYDRVQI